MSTLPTESLPIINPEDFKSTPQSVLNGSPQNHNGQQQLENPLHPPPPFRKYTRQQLVHLSTSSLVKPPPNMPELKVWFGSENENLVKKEDPFTPSTARERRFRRDADDGDASSRPTFRSGLTQPSQMGNFKHQSLRANDRDRERDRDRDGEKERERDIRDKEGQERLRHLSDKYDRDRLAQPQSNARNKERDPAPHLNAPTRPTQALASNTASRRAETRESAKKKIGEASEDWRRGAEPRTSRDDRAENGRREDRDRARSRVRDSSGAKREPSASRRDRERDEPRERTLRGDREREDHRRDDARRDRDFETEEDARRWRDDGKREERIAARRERGRDKGNQDGHWEGGTDRRWTPGDDRDGRYKRSSGRERRTANGPDDIKERDDRRDKEREKEKEPAWMDTYVPGDSSPGILGGHGVSGELDGIQAFKKEQKDKELKDKAANLSAPPVAQDLEETSLSVLHADMKQEPLDEIQLFKRMMLKDQQKLNPNAFPNQHEIHSSSKDDGMMTSTKLRHDTSNEDSATVTGFSGLVSKIDHPQFRTSKDPSTSTDSSSLTLDPKEPLSLTKVLPTPNLSPNRNSANVFTSFAAPETSQLNPAKQGAEPNTAPSFQPPAGSRLLAFAKTPANLSNVDNNLHPPHESTQNYSKPESSHTLSAFSPFEEQRRQAHGFEDTRDMGVPSNHLNIHHRPVEPIFNSNANSPDPNFNGVSGPKGSRFAKFFDGKSRDGVPSSKQQLPGMFLSPSPNQNQRPEQSGFGGLNVNPGDGRTMDDLFAMLRNSTQQGDLTQSPNASTPLTNNGTLGTQGQGLYTFQQHPPQQTQHHSNRLEPLYDSRADDRSFVPDGMVPGLRPIPPLRRDNNPAHFGDDDSMHYNLQRIAQQQQSRNLEPLYPGPTPIYGQQTNRQAGLSMQSLQQSHYRGGPSPNLNQLGPLPTGPPQQRLPPGLANLGGRPPHEPSQFIGLPGLPSNGPHSNLHTLQQQQQQLPFSNFNVNNGFNSVQPRGPAPSSHVHNNNAQQHPLGNIGHPSMDPRLANHHHLMGLGGSGVGSNRTNGSFPHQGPAAPSHPVIRSQQQPPLMPHMLPHLLPPHLQQQGHPGNNQPTHDLMALLMGGHRE